MSYLIHLNNKHKKIIEQYIYKHPFSSIFISNTFYKKGIENNGDLDSADFYGLFKDNKLIGLCGIFNLNITIFSCPKYIETIFLKKLPYSQFYISRNAILNKQYENIKNEIFMIYKNKKFNYKYPEEISLIDKNTKNEILNLKIDFEKEYWNYIPDKEHINEFKNNIQEKIIQNNIFTYKINNITVACGFIEAENTRCALIGSIFVKKEFRNQGIGKIITEKIIYSILKRNKIPALTVEKKNLNAFNIYKKIGFCEISSVYMFGKEFFY